MILNLLDESRQNGARNGPACETLGISKRTVERWRSSSACDDLRQGPKSQPRNKLSPMERRKIIATMNSPEYRDLSPNQIVPLLADKGDYLASESSFYRILREEKLQNHRESSRPSTHARPAQKVATGPNQIWSWDITYLQSPVRGQFYYLYMVMDVCCAGLDLQVRQSGKFKGKTKISKRGRTALRKVLTFAVLPLVKKNGLYGKMYHGIKDKREMPGAKAMMIIAKKFLKMIFGIYRSGAKYDASRVFECHSQHKKAA